MNKKENQKYLEELLSRRYTHLKMYHHELRQERAQIMFNQMQREEANKCDCSICDMTQCPFRNLMN